MPMDLSSLALRGADPGAPARRRRPPRRPRTRSRRDLVRIFLVLLALTFVLRAPGVLRRRCSTPTRRSSPPRPTSSNDGGELYEDAIDRKPPLVPYIYAATFAFFETTALWSVRVVAMLAVALTALLLAIEARRRVRRRARLDRGRSCSSCAMVAFAPQDGQAANFEVFMLPSMTAAVLFARDAGAAFLAGVAIAAATLAKQTGAATLLPVVYLHRTQRGKRGIADGGRRLHASRPRWSRCRRARRSSSTGRCWATARTSA